MRTRAFWFSLFLSPVLALANEAQFQTLDQYTRIQIPVTGATTYRLVTGRDGEASLTLDRIQTSWIQSLNSSSDARLEKIQVHPVGLDKAEIKLKFADPNTESFAYLQGGKLVIDIWKEDQAMVKGKPQPAVTKNAAKKIFPQRKLAALPNPKKTERKLASIPSTKRENALLPLQKDIDIFQKFVFPMPDLVIPSTGESVQLPPKGEIDGLWSFSKGDAKSTEGKSYEFAKKLYNEKKYGLAIKTIQIIQRDEQNTPHMEEIKFLEALCFRKLGEVEKSDALAKKGEAFLEELGSVRRKDGSLMPYHGSIRFYFAQKEYLKQNWLQSILHLEYVAQITPASDVNFPYIQMMLADSYARVNQPRRAERIFRYLVEKHSKHIVAKEAKYRIADLLALEKNYERVIEEGESAVASYPEFERARAEVIFQLGEASFWLGQYKRAEKYFKSFTEKYSAHTIAAFAWIRLGEISELSKGDIEKARTFYMNAKNGYPFSQGDLVATVRLARVDIDREKDPNFTLQSLKSLLKDKTIDIELRHMANLTYIQYLLVTKEVDQAIEASREGMAKSEGVPYEAYKKNLVNSLYAKLEKLKEEKKFTEALALYKREQKWIDLYGPETFSVLADTHKGLGLYATANDLMARYLNGSAQGRMIASLGKNSEFSLEKAKNLYELGNYAEALQYLPDGEDGKTLFIRGLSEFRLGRKKQSYIYAEKALMDNDVQFSDSEIESLMEVLNDRSFQDRDFARMESEVKKAKSKLQKDSVFLDFALAEATWYQKRHSDAIKLYREAMAKQEKGELAERGKYHIGLSYIALGKREEAVKELTALVANSQGVWSESAKQELELLQWESKYSSVLKTLPPSGLGIAN
jgi:tetratricopeptide (TPR) repeat protein